jgi:hypothetical protein
MKIFGYVGQMVSVMRDVLRALLLSSGRYRMILTNMNFVYKLCLCSGPKREDVTGGWRKLHI